MPSGDHRRDFTKALPGPEDPERDARRAVPIAEGGREEDQGWEEAKTPEAGRPASESSAEARPETVAAPPPPSMARRRMPLPLTPMKCSSCYARDQCRGHHWPTRQGL